MGNCLSNCFTMDRRTTSSPKKPNGAITTLHVSLPGILEPGMSFGNDDEKGENREGSTEDEIAKILKAMAYHAFSTLSSPQRALNLFMQAHKVQVKNLGVEHPETLHTLEEISTMLLALGRYDEALKLQYEIYEGFKSNFGTEHRETAISERNIAALHLKQGKLDEALELFKEVFLKFRRVFGEKHPETMATLGQIAWTLSERGDYDEAIVLLNQVTIYMTENLGREHPTTRATLQDLQITMERAVASDRRKMWRKF